MFEIITKAKTIKFEVNGISCKLKYKNINTYYTLDF